MFPYDTEVFTTTRLLKLKHAEGFAVVADFSKKILKSVARDEKLQQKLGKCEVALHP